MKKVKLVILLTMFLTIFGCSTSKNVTVDNKKASAGVVHKKVIYELYCDSIQKERVSKWTLECMELTRGKNILPACAEEAEAIFCSYKKGILYTTNGTSYFIPCDKLPEGSVDSVLCGCE